MDPFQIHFSDSGQSPGPRPGPGPGPRTRHLLIKIIEFGLKSEHVAQEGSY